MILRLLLCLLALVPMVMPAAAQQQPTLEAVSRHYAAALPGLETYRTEVQTSKLDEMIRQMTANMPADLPRPETPQLFKYWSRDAGRAIIRMEVEQPFPYMADMVRRFSERFNIDLKSLFLPTRGSAERRKLLQNATIKQSESQVENSRNLHIVVEFAEPTDLGEAFFREGLALPQTGIVQMDFDIDPDIPLLRRMELTDATRRYAVEIRHRALGGGHLPQEIRITTPDGSIDDRFVTTFEQVNSHVLPTQQVRTLRHNNREETITVSFTDYRLNLALPANIVQELNQGP